MVPIVLDFSAIVSVQREKEKKFYENFKHFSYFICWFDQKVQQDMGNVQQEKAWPIALN